MSTYKSQDHYQAHKNNEVTCDICKRDPFSIEDVRNLAARLGDKQIFLSTYKHYSSNLVNNNTRSFWDKKFRASENLSDQDLMTKEKIDFIVSLLPNTRATILDVGIGQGYLEQRLKHLGVSHKIYGFDISKQAITRAKKKFDGTFATGDILEKNIFYKRNFYDVIVAIEVIEHIPPAKIFSFYKRVFTSLKPGGKFIISTPINEGLRYSKVNPSAHVRDFTIPILKTEFKLSGFKIQIIKTHYAFKKYYRFKKIIASFINRWEANNVIVAANKVGVNKLRRGRDSNSR